MRASWRGASSATTVLTSAGPRLPTRPKTGAVVLLAYPGSNLAFRVTNYSLDLRHAMNSSHVSLFLKNKVKIQGGQILSSLEIIEHQWLCLHSEHNVTSDSE